MIDHLEAGCVEGVIFFIAADVVHWQNSRVYCSIESLRLVDVVGWWGRAVSGGEIVVESRMKGGGFAFGGGGGGSCGGGGGGSRS